VVLVEDVEGGLYTREVLVLAVNLRHRSMQSSPIQHCQSFILGRPKVHRVAPVLDSYTITAPGTDGLGSVEMRVMPTDCSHDLLVAAAPFRSPVSRGGPRLSCRHGLPLGDCIERFLSSNNIALSNVVPKSAASHCTPSMAVRCCPLQNFLVPLRSIPPHHKHCGGL
jgi:hypothetical protein